MRFITAPVVIFIVGAFAPPVVAQTFGMSARDQELHAFAAELDSLRAAHHIPGLAVAMLRDQKVVLSKGYGFADPDHEVPVTPDTPLVGTRKPGSLRSI